MLPLIRQLSILLAVSMHLLFSSALWADASHHTKQALADQISISDAYVRGLPPGQKVTAAFFTLSNNSAEDIVLQKVSSPVANSAEVHETSNTGGQMQMRHIKELSIKAGETVMFQSGGKHIMLFGLNKTLTEGEQVALRLCFGDFCRVFEAPVVSVLNEKKVDHHHHH